MANKQPIKILESKIKKKLANAVNFIYPIHKRVPIIAMVIWQGTFLFFDELRDSKKNESSDSRQMKIKILELLVSP